MSVGILVRERSERKGKKCPILSGRRPEGAGDRNSFGGEAVRHVCFEAFERFEGFNSSHAEKKGSRS